MNLKNPTIKDELAIILILDHEFSFISTKRTLNVQQSIMISNRRLARIIRNFDEKISQSHRKSTRSVKRFHATFINLSCVLYSVSIFCLFLSF